MEIVEPQPRLNRRSVASATRPASLRGASVGVLDGWGSRAPDGAIAMYPVLAEIVEGLRRHAQIGEVVWLQKQAVIAPPTGDELDRLKTCTVVITGVGVSGASTASAVADAVILEEAGIPTLTVCDAAYEDAAHAFARRFGLPDLAVFAYDSPAGGNMARDSASDEDLGAIIAALTAQHRALDQPRVASGDGARRPSSLVADADEWYARALAEGWTEGLPVCPPTREAVERMLDHLAGDPDEVIGEVPPQGGLADLRQVAVNSVMAGCTPELAPVVLAAVRAVLDPAFKLAGEQVTTNGVTPLVIVSGPIVERLGFNARHGSFTGRGHANATVGRAVQLILRNVGGAIPGETAMVTHGHPGWLSFCVAENTAESPWPPLHVDRGFPAEASCVTAFACQAPFPLYVPGSADRILRVIATTLPTPGINAYFAGGEILVVLGPTPARELARAGLDRAAVRQRIWEEARFELGVLRRSGVFESERNTFYWGIRAQSPALDALADDVLLPLVDGPEDFHVLVSGAAGQWWAAFCAGWGEFGGCAVTVEVSGS